MINKAFFFTFLFSLFAVGQSAYAAIALYGTTDVSGVSNIPVDGGSGLDRVMILAGSGETSDSLVSVTWNGEDFTKEIAQVLPATGRYNYVWCLAPKSTGTHTFHTATANGVLSGAGMVVMVYTGAGFCKNPNTASGTGTTGSVSLSANNGDWLVGGGANDASVLSMGSNTTQRGFTGSSVGVADSNGTASPTALNFAFSNANWLAYGIVISPQTTPDPTNRLIKYATNTSVGTTLLSDDGTNTILTIGNLFFPANSGIDSAFAGILNLGTATATAITIGHSGATTTIAGPLSVASFSVASIQTNSNCASTASPSSCSSASAGSVAIAAGDTTLVVNTTAVTAVSQIFITEDTSLGSRLGITCNATPGRSYSITSRVAGTSFTVRSSGDIATNKACLNYLIAN